ncbi:uncharacterized protein A1O5_10573 [Cladophialophora psammophila CBS 110553]|uniref:Uncharacterized protein n=1 Tax=Cladophialophora psammophila CBS 110553 TaxID=1182543 RepID=W9WP52_9EURO|nr:uncharacterized protein A1O5_10573 [Cladophialophora psammophila CBS 110553]EXJ66421.1 hypothetical protein A1O5_10573 [Cladophialophora psammophila CBS 110553]
MFALLLDSEYVQIRPEGGSAKDKEQYQPCHDDFAMYLKICLWDSQTLQHSRILTLVPRKLKGQLVVPNGLLSNKGWGMQPVDYIDGRLIELIGS